MTQHESRPGGLGAVRGFVNREYDSAHRLESLWVNRILSGEAGLVARYHYDRDGLMTGTDRMTMPRDPVSGDLLGTTLESVETTRSVNAQGELVSEEARYDGKALYSEAILERDLLGRITRRRETVQGHATEYGYDYDLAGRLWKVRIDGTQVREYRYDDNGNRTAVISAAGTETCSYDEQDRLTGCGAASYEHDALGQRTAKVTAGVRTHYNYNALGELYSVVGPDGHRISYDLDPTGRRVGKRENGQRRFGLLYQTELAPIAQLDPQNKVVSTFVYASSDHVPDYMVKQGRVYRFITDHLGSVRLVVEVKTGKVEQRIDYDEFGVVLLDTNPGFQPFGFAGGIYDPDTRLVRFGAREYDAATGRWTGKDPARFVDGTNVYLYAGMDPVNFIDPNGLFVPQAIGAVIGAGFAVYSLSPGASAGQIATAALIGAGAGVLASFGATPAAAALYGAAGGIAGDVGRQLLVDETRVQDLDVASAATSGLAGLVGGNLGKRFLKGAADSAVDELLKGGNYTYQQARGFVNLARYGEGLVAGGTAGAIDGSLRNGPCPIQPSDATP